MQRLKTISVFNYTASQSNLRTEVLEREGSASPPQSLDAQ